jgi:starvation-inducible DNA-binding protein
MATTVDHLPALMPHGRAEVGRELQATLVELIDLSLVGKQFHWTLTGPHFMPLHLQLDELVDSWRELADVVAERAIALGFVPDGQAATVSQAPDLEPFEQALTPDREVVRHLTGRLSEIAERIRARIDRVGAIDVASQDVLIEVVREVEKQLWMIRSQKG